MARFQTESRLIRFAIVLSLFGGFVLVFDVSESTQESACVIGSLLMALKWLG